MTITRDYGPRTLLSHTQLTRGRGPVLYWILLISIVAIFTLAFIGPLYWMVTSALKTGQEVAQTPPTLFPARPDPQNYIDAWNNLTLGKLLFNTVYYAVGA